MREKKLPAGERARAEKLVAYFEKEFGRAPERLFSSPGRAEIVGNHTDHNRGKVLVSAISCDILCAVAAGGDSVEIRAREFRSIRIPLGDLAPREEERGKSTSLVRGVLAYFCDRGYPVGGFSACTSSNIFRGAGVSSSAAFEVLVAQILNTLFGGGLPPEDLARAAQFAENEYFGKPCGLLDQTGIALGGFRKIDFFDPMSPKSERVPEPKGYFLAVTNTGGSHASLTPLYSEIGAEMRAVAETFGKSVLREVKESEFYGRIPRLRERLGDRAVLRAIHFFEENRRVDRAASALKRHDVHTFSEQIRASGESSLRYLQNCYVPGETRQPVVMALKESERILKSGCFRMQGGGFAGSVIAFVNEEEREPYARAMARLFGKENVRFAAFRARGTCEIEI